MNALLEERMIVTSATTIDAALTQQLVRLGEEERLARDLYTAFHDRWGVQVFYCLAEEEERHTSTLRTILDRNGVPNRLTILKPGSFDDPALQERYDDLVERGTTSLDAAYAVGADIERAEIGLSSRVVSETARPDIAVVARDLRKHDYNHLAILTFLTNK